MLIMLFMPAIMLSDKLLARADDVCSERPRLAGPLGSVRAAMCCALTSVKLWPHRSDVMRWASRFCALIEICNRIPVVRTAWSYAGKIKSLNMHG